MRWIVTLVLALGLAACLENHDPPSLDGPVDAPSGLPDATPIECPRTGPGAPSGGCEAVVDRIDDCPSIEELCRPDICGGHDCCFCQADGTWGDVITDCFEGCNFGDAGVD